MTAVQTINNISNPGASKVFNPATSVIANFSGKAGQTNPYEFPGDVRQTMRQVLVEIQDGSFAEKWLDENSNGREKFLAMRSKDADHQLEQVGRDLRAMMTWLEPVEK